ncbi:MAG: ABC transporter ATP-binding protein [Pseudomonadota bacterium]
MTTHAQQIGENGAGNAPVLTLHHVDKTFGSGRGVTPVRALADFSLSVRQGDFLSLLGPSGCGKSTALRLVANLMRPTSGRIVWGDPSGPSAGRASKPATGDLGVVFQEPTLMPWATVEDNVYLPFRLAGESKSAVGERIHEMLDLVGLAGFEKAYPRELSGGMKMRVSIARAMVTKPKLILMDEPFAALDEITRFKLNNDLLAMQARIGCTVLFVTHSVFESVFLSNRIVVMAARPGRQIAEICVDEPYPRSEQFRTTAEYASLCRQASDALHRAIDERAAA